VYWDALDDYGGAGELAMIERYWPDHAKRWFDAVGHYSRRDVLA